MAQRKFFCTLCGSNEHTRIVAVDAVLPDNEEEEGSEIRVSIECTECPEHLACQVYLPSELLVAWELPVVGTNIYSPLRDRLKDQNSDEEDNEV